MVKKKKCEYCIEEIKDKDTYVLLATISPKKEQKSYFHMNCFKKNHDEKVEAKVRNIITAMQQKAKGVLEGIQGIVGNFKGMNNLGSIFNLDLSKEMPDINQEIPNLNPKKKKNE